MRHTYKYSTAVPDKYRETRCPREGAVLYKYFVQVHIAVQVLELASQMSTEVQIDLDLFLRFRTYMDILG